MFWLKRQVQQFQEQLNDGRPRFVLVTTDSDTAGSEFLAEVRKNATERGWQIVPANPQRSLLVGASTRPADFYADLRDITGRGETSDEPADERAIAAAAVRLMANIAPVLIQWEGFKPDSEFAEWFAGEFLSELRKLPLQLVLAATDMARNVIEISGVADEIIDLDAADPIEVRAALTELGQDMRPVMERKELDCYCEEIAANPSLLDSLMRILSLTRTDRQEQA